MNAPTAGAANVGYQTPFSWTAPTGGVSVVLIAGPPGTIGHTIVTEGTPASLKADLRARRGLDADPTLDDVFLDVTGRQRERRAGEVSEVAS